MDDSYLNCTLISEKVICDGIFYAEEVPPLYYTEGTFWLYCGGYIGLILIAGLMSGLTLGLLSLDLTSLKVLQEGGKLQERKYAAKIIPLLKRHHWLLVTLLLCNAAAVETMPLCLDRISDPITAIFASVTAVLIFGEVIPQAVCTRYGLAIGAALSPLVYVLFVLTFVVSYPISKLLDFLLGTEHGTFYRRAELKALVGMHGPQAIGEKYESSANKDPLTKQEVVVIKGALEFREKIVSTAMLSLDKVFMLSTNTVLDENSMQKILSVGHSRIPVYETSNENIVGVLLVKTLLCLNPQDKIQLKQIINSKYIRAVHKVYDIMPLYELLNIFQTGKSHLSIVYRSEGNLENIVEEPNQESKILGIITLEDVIEELIQEEILDEKDVPETKAVTSIIRRQSKIRRPPRKISAEADLRRPPSDTALEFVGNIQDEASETTHLLAKHKTSSTFSLP